MPKQVTTGTVPTITTQEILAENSPKEIVSSNLGRRLTNPVTIGKKTLAKANVPTIGIHLQQPVNQLMLQQLQVLNKTVDIE
jgi:hypothetical protein